MPSNIGEKSTVAAISTPFGKGGVAIIRISGPDAIAVGERMFKSKSNKKLSQLESGRTCYAEILKEGEVIDDGIFTLFRAPHSYTGEDTVEISCHGGILITGEVLESALLSGAVAAGPGEFTKRAFLNGKLSLSQAEAVIDIIEAQNKEKIKLSRSHTRGILKDKIDKIVGEIKEIIASTYAFIDYPDEDLTDIDTDEMETRLEALTLELEKLRDSYKKGKAISEGVNTVIVGKPNTGKSSLLNLLAKEERAIVTDIAGTTRDVIEEKINIGKIMLNVFDTAGIRKTENLIESTGIEKAKEKIKTCELILALFDGSLPITREDREVIEVIKNTKSEFCDVICIINKSDISLVSETEEYLKGEFLHVVNISAVTGSGEEELLTKIEKTYIEKDIDYRYEVILSNSRQYTSVIKAYEAVKRAKDALLSGFSQDISGLDLEEALGHLLELDGRQITKEITDQIFSRFCVGK